MRRLRTARLLRRVRAAVPLRLHLLVCVALVASVSSCVGSGKTARTESIEPLPAGMRIVSDVTMGCRSGESGFDYRFLVVGQSNDVSPSSPFLSALRSHDFYHSIGLDDDLPWISVGYQNLRFPLRAEVGLLSRYLAHPLPFQGPSPSALPIDVVAQSDHYLIVAMRPTDFACATPL